LKTLGTIADAAAAAAVAVAVVGAAFDCCSTTKAQSWMRMKRRTTVAYA
jgi:hypothetical protein